MALLGFAAAILAAVVLCMLMLHLAALGCKEHPPPIPKGRKAASCMTEEFARRFGQCCLKCGDTESLCWDHIQPVSKGGLNYLGNIQALCRRCNSSKGDRFADYRTQEQRDWCKGHRT